jgi:glycosyltransferase involved in cell wall biosynthesis
MKVILEAQYACTAEPRGIGVATIKTISKLLERSKNEYELTFFDFQKERNNRQYINKYFGKYNPIAHECNELDYRILPIWDDEYADRPYNDYMNTNGDIYHFLRPIAIPTNLKGKMIVTILDMIPQLFPKTISGFEYNIFKTALNLIQKMNPHIITISQSAKNDILNYFDFDESNIDVVPCGIDKTIIGEKQSVSKYPYPYFYYVGSIEHRKNILRILEAFETTAEKYADVRLILSGSRTVYQDIDEAINTHKYRDRIILTGYASEEEKNNLLTNATAFLFPSLYEGFGLPVLEAMACGCPVITSNVSSLPEVTGDAGILIDPTSTEQLSFQMERVLLSPSLQSDLRKKGIERAKLFTWDRTAELTEQVYKKVMNEF